MAEFRNLRLAEVVPTLYYYFMFHDSAITDLVSGHIMQKLLLLSRVWFALNYIMA